MPEYFYSGAHVGVALRHFHSGVALLRRDHVGVALNSNSLRVGVVGRPVRYPPVGNTSRPVRYQSAGRRHRLAGTLQYPPVSKYRSAGTSSAVSDAGRPVRYPLVGDTGRPVRYAGRKYRSAGTLSAGRQYRSKCAIRRSEILVGRYAIRPPVGDSGRPVRCNVRRSANTGRMVRYLPVSDAGRPMRYPPVGDTGRPVRYAGRQYRSAGTISAAAAHCHRIPAASTGTRLPAQPRARKE